MPADQLTEEEKLSKLRAVHEGDLLKALSKQRADARPVDFAAGYARAIQNISLRNIGSLTETMRRILDEKELTGDILGFFEISAASLRIASELLNEPPPEELLKTIQETEEKFLSVLSDQRAMKFIEKLREDLEKGREKK